MGGDSGEGLAGGSGCGVKKVVAGWVAGGGGLMGAKEGVGRGGGH